MLSSRASTPYFGTLNSHRDMHPSSASLATSASRTLDRPRPNTLDRGTARSRHVVSLEQSVPALVHRRQPQFETRDSYEMNGNHPDLPPQQQQQQMSFRTFQGRSNAPSRFEETSPGLNNNVTMPEYINTNNNNRGLLVLCQ